MATMSDEAPDLGQAEMDEVHDQRADELQAELDRLATERRAASTERMSLAEGDNYARNHKVIERDESGEPIEHEE